MSKTSNILDPSDLQTALDEFARKNNLAPQVQVPDEPETEKEDTVDAAPESDAPRADAQETQPEQPAENEESQPEGEDEVADKQESDKEAEAEEKPTKEHKETEEDEDPVKELAGELTKRKAEESDEDEDYDDPALSEKIVKRLKNAKKEQRRIREEYEAKLAEREAKLKEIEAKLAEKPEGPSDTQLEELKMLRRKLALENDPEFRQKFDAKIEASDKAARAILKKYFKPDAHEMIDKLKSVDDWAVNSADDFRGVLERIQDANPAEAEVLKRKVTDIISTREERALAADEAAKTANEWWEQRQKEEQEKAQSLEQHQHAVKESLKTAVERVIQHERFQDKPVPKDAPEPDKKRLEAHNQVAAKMRRVLESVTQFSDPAQVVEIAAAAALAYQFKHENESLKSEVQRLEAEIEKRKNAGRVSSSKATNMGTPEKKAEGYKPTGDLSKIDADFDNFLKTKR